MSRLDLDLKDIDFTADDILKEFSFMNVRQVQEAIKKGALGLYGSTYRLNTQEVCLWIRKYIASKKTTLGL